jgi:hypothetical protein
MKWTFLSLLGLILVTGCASQYGHISGNFNAPRIEGELNYLVACRPLYPTNHFYAGASTLDGANMLEGFVYWKEERILLLYDELVPDAPYDIEAWPNRHWKLGRDTVKTSEEINGSDYLITDANWHDWVNQCISKGKQYVVLRDDARRRFPGVEIWNDD